MLSGVRMHPLPHDLNTDLPVRRLLDAPAPVIKSVQQYAGHIQNAKAWQTAKSDETTQGLHTFWYRTFIAFSYEWFLRAVVKDVWSNVSKSYSLVIEAPEFYILSQEDACVYAATIPSFGAQVHRRIFHGFMFPLLKAAHRWNLPEWMWYAKMQVIGQEYGRANAGPGGEIRD